mgnify:CR=1 FL=1
MLSNVWGMDSQKFQAATTPPRGRPTGSTHEVHAPFARAFRDGTSLDNPADALQADGAEQQQSGSGNAWNSALSGVGELRIVRP